MRGKIKYINEDTEYKFRGTITGEDGRTYRFNPLNWLRKDISLNDIYENQEVEFDLKEPNKYGYVFPKSIRFPGETEVEKSLTNFLETNHRYGRFNDFVRVKTESILLVLEQLVEEFALAPYANTSSLYKKLALTYNSLQDADFIFSGNDEHRAVFFPSGFVDKNGESIYLYCTLISEEDAIKWHCDKVYVGESTYGGAVFSLINANWYDVEESICNLTSENKVSTKTVIQKIEKRCVNKQTSFIYLRNGQLCAQEDADELYVPTDFYEPGGKELYLLCTRRKGNRGFGWYFVTATYESASITVFEKKNWMEKWCGQISLDVFKKLADLTLDEQWSFGEKDDYGILRNYLRYTFAYQFMYNRVGYSPDQSIAAFNTGLPDRNTYKYLYAVFEKVDYAAECDLHPLFHKEEFVFKEFVLSGRGGYGKLVSNMRPLPEPPHYFEARKSTVWELDFNDSNQITIPEYDDVHILIQRCERIPLDFYRYPASKSPRLSEIIDSSEAINEKYKAIREFFKPVIDGEPDNEVSLVYRTLHSSLDEVISTAVKKLSWNWRAVVPCYNPERNEACYLLPVSFSNPMKPDRAMIASVNNDGDGSVYTIHTVIPLDWAYLNARLVCRPESEWLAANYIEEE